MSESSPKTSPVTLKFVLLWSLPALVIGLALRVLFMVQIPEAYYASDSNSSFSTVRDLYLEGRLKIEAKRRWLYPILLIPAPVLPANTPQVVAVAQHAAGLVTVVGVGWILAHLTRFRGICVMAGTTVLAIWPKTLWYEHEMIAETYFLTAYVLALCAAFPLERLRNPAWLMTFLGLCAVVVALKPSGKAIWLLALLAAVVLTWPVWKTWRWYHLAAVVAGLVLAVTGGSSGQTGWLLLSSTLPLVNPARAGLPEYSEILDPHIASLRGDLWNYAFLERRWKGILKEDDPNGLLGPKWGALADQNKEFGKVGSRLAKDAILHHPFGAALLTWNKFIVAASDNVGPGIVPTDNASARSPVPAQFWELQARANDGRWVKRPHEMEMLYEMSADEYKAMVAERVQRVDRIEAPLRAFHSRFVWAHRSIKPGKPIKVDPSWLTLLALAGAVGFVCRRRWEVFLLLVIPAGAYLITVYGVGDAVLRYMIPVEWVGIVLAVAGLDTLGASLLHLGGLVRRARSN